MIHVMQQRRRSPPPTDEQIHDGHRELLASYQEFLEWLDPPDGGAVDVHGLRAAVAFLRESLLPFAAWEQSASAEGAELAEDVAFEHACLAIEIDALDRAVLELSSIDFAAHDIPADLVRRVRRHGIRLEAMLEMHVLKAEDRPARTAAPDEPPGMREGSDGPDRALARARSLEQEEAKLMLVAAEWGILCTIGDGRPYGVPVSYHFDGDDLFIVTGPGKKERNLAANPAVCLTVSRIESRVRWDSVVVSGRVEWVNRTSDRLRLLNLLRRKLDGSGRVSLGDITRLRRARIARIQIDELSGRSCGSP